MFQYLIVSFNFPGGEAPDGLGEVINEAQDWANFIPNSWILYTDVEPKEWHEKFKPLINTGDHYFIVEIDIRRRAGWLPNSIWKWINEKRR